MTDDASFMENMQSYDIPGRKAILQYLVRMGSFTSAPKIPNEDKGDEDVSFGSCMTWQNLRDRCNQELVSSQGRMQRCVLKTYRPRSLQDILSYGGEQIRIMQWNILAQGLADGYDVFPRCPKNALEWTSRRWKILKDIAIMQPDILCMQEVDHFKFFEKALSTLGFVGNFCPKPDSPCLYIQGNNGPDGCAIFINTNIFEILDIRSRILEICTCQTNQVALFCKIRRRSDGAVLWVATTHLKARTGPIMEGLRREQGADLVNYIHSTVGNRTPLLLTGDFNATPSEPIHELWKTVGLENAYAHQNPSYTTWTVRNTGEYARTLDYIMYSQKAFVVDSVVRMPSEIDIGFERVPCQKYPSDHFSLVANMVLRRIGF